MKEAKVYILDQNFQSVLLITEYVSFLWCERYTTCGDFEIFAYPSPEIIQYAVKNNYIWKSDTKYMMIIEELELTSDVDNGVHLIIRGRSLESILDRRIVWVQTRVRGNIQACIKRLITESITSPVIPERKIDNFIFKDTTNNYITTTEIDKQYTGDNLLEIVVEICEENGIGFRILLNDDNQFVFELFQGIDRSYSQEVEPYVTFSPRYSNLINSNYFESIQQYKNVTLVAGAGEDDARKTKIVGTTAGLLRRELYTDARDIQDKDENQNPIPDSIYYAALEKRGREKLAEVDFLEYFEGEIDSTGQLFAYDRDFFMGDVVQVANEFDMTGKARIVEFITSYGEDGIKQYPTFKIIQEEDTT